MASMSARTAALVLGSLHNCCKLSYCYPNNEAQSFNTSGSIQTIDTRDEFKLSPYTKHCATNLHLA
nr:hypothetical protein Iba_chr10aCG9840 [Ipomoea batatas]GMD45348.1 hypothetical protein Iba_chr10dCG9180 [Ipomoea batatas]GMD46836.1 hypothetical protein Iba_chr10eCG7160 [Ipomoea batatas]GMD48165.1 hypothetical protein Iba_chr10fCG3780 [Ipomoea batatas]